MFEGVSFIKANIPFRKDKYYAPMFRKKFTYGGEVNSARIFVCGLGYGYYYLNGVPVSDDLFTAPVGNYKKTLWYNSYDVTDKIKSGGNILAVICGNGWYNEGIRSAWDYDTASWRDDPKFILRLEINGETVLTSDGSFRCSINSPVTYNQLRSGEHFDARLYDENWKSAEYDDSGWDHAVRDNTPPAGKFRECLCEPIRECEVYETKKITKTGDDRYVFDIGRNISGYIRLRIKQKSGDRLVIRYAEQLNEDSSPALNGMDTYYYGSCFQTDEFICCGKEFVWSPKFTYHGFRYIEISGIEDPTADMVSGVFVHQKINRKTSFACSDEGLNSLFEAGVMSTLSNMFYMPTDCPTREKLGWTNDAQMSAEQMIFDFGCEKVLKKWLTDIYDAMLPDGSLPGTVPTPGFGYTEYGPVCDGVLFEIPYEIYRYTGKTEMLTDSLPYFGRYLAYLKNKANERGEMSFGLNDWAAPDRDDAVGETFINALLKIRFLRIAQIAAKTAGESTEELKKEEESEIKRIKSTYIAPNGECTINKQTAAAMLICFGIYDNKDPLVKQLERLVRENDYHHDCGMAGMKYLFEALNICRLEEYAYKILTSRGFPSYMDWIENGATTLYEFWDRSGSKNHHMYSCFMVWLIRTVLGINADNGRTIRVSPCFIKELEFAEGYYMTDKGILKVKWKRNEGGVRIMINVPVGDKVMYEDKILEAGENIFYKA